MASVKRRTDGAWRARYRDAGGKEHSRHFARKVDAQRWLDGVTTALVTGAYVDPAAGRTTVGVVAAAWLDGHPGWSASTLARNASILTRHVLPRWGTVPVSKVTFEEVQTWVTELSASGLAGGTVRKVLGVLSSVLGLAVKAKRLATNPTTGVDLPRQRLARRRYLSVSQVEALAEAAGDQGDVVLTLAYTGLRIGELAALRAQHVELVRRRVRIEESVTEVNGVVVRSAPKDHQRRSVPLPPFLADRLAARLTGRGTDDPVFGSRRGGVLRVRNMRRDWFDAAAVAAGVPGLTPHELRHTAASLAVSAGASVLGVQRMLGHDKASTTLDVYSDLFDADLDAVADRLADTRSRILADSVRTSALDDRPLGADLGL